MPVLILLLALFIPRVTLFLLWLLTTWFQGVFNSVLWPVAGFFFLPLTTLWYSVVVKYFGGEWGIVPIIGGVIAVLIDLSPVRYHRRRIVVVEEA